MAGASPTELTNSATAIESLPDEILAEVMLRVPTPAALVHAAAASRRWCGVIATGKFLRDYRERHRSSPFLGLYVPREFGGLPTFQMADSIRSADADADHDLQRAAEKASSLGGLESHPDWRLLDCHNGRLLLTRGDESLVVYSPLSGERILVRLPRDDVHPDLFSAASACLLRGHGDAASFRVFFVQHRRRGQMVRAIEYDSCKKSWQYYPWETLSNIEGTLQGEMRLMHAGGLIFCKSVGPSLLLLDTSKKEFCIIPLPGDNNPKHYSIGEMEDGVCCLASVEFVGISNKCRLRVWRLEQLNWKLVKEMEVKQVLGKHAIYSYYSIRTVTNGIALLCSNKRHLHFIVDLTTFSLKEKFEFKDMTAYPMHMPWPPAFSVATVTEATNPGSSDGNSDKQPKPSASEDLDGQDLERRMSLVGLEHGTRCPFADSNGLHPKYTKDPESPHIQERKHNWGSIQVCIKTQRCLEDWGDIEGEVSRSGEGGNASFNGITGFQDYMQFQPINYSNQCDNGMAESNMLVIPDLGGVERGYANGRLQGRASVEVTGQLEGSLEPDGAVCAVVHDPLTLQANLDGQYAESKLNKDPEIRCNDDVVILGCSHGNRPESRDESAIHNHVPSTALEDLGIQEPIAASLTTAQTGECSDRESDVRNGHDVEALM